MKFYKIREELSNGMTISILPLRVTFYARVSTDSDEQLNSLTNQIAYFKNYIKDNKNWIYIEGYVDEGISGSSVKNRKQFLKMIEDAKKGLFDLIITKEVSRFSRNLADSIKYTQQLMMYDVGVFFQTNGINTYDINSEFILNMMGSVAQEEVKRLSERIKWGHKNAIKQGRVLGSNRITGYKKDCASLIIEEEEAKLVRLAYELYVTGKYGFSKLAKKLYEMGYKNGNGKIYSRATLQRIIKNPKYKGYYSGGTTKTIDYKTKKREYLKKDDWIVYKDSKIPAIVSEELWDLANNLLNARRIEFSDHNKNTTSNFRKYAYSGKIYCKEHNYTFQRSHGSKKKNRPIWACGYYMLYRKSACQSPIIAEMDLDNIMNEVFNKIFDDKEKITKEMVDYYKETEIVDNYENEIRKCNLAIEVINNKKEKLLELTIAGNLLNNEFEERNNKYNDSLLELKTKIDNLREEQLKVNGYFKNMIELEEKIKGELGFQNAIYEMVNSFVEEIIVSKIDNDRKNIKLDIYINFNIKEKRERGSKYLENIEKVAILTRSISSVEKKKKNIKPNWFEYNLYIEKSSSDY